MEPLRQYQICILDNYPHIIRYTINYYSTGKSSVCITSHCKKNVNKCLYKSTHETIKLLAFGDKLLLFTTITVCT